MTSRRPLSLALVVAVALAGCGSNAASPPHTNPRTASAGSSTQQPASTTYATTGADTSSAEPASPPPLGTTLTRHEDAGSVTVIAGGSGFSLVGYPERGEASPGVITFAQSGQQLAEIPSTAMTPECGAIDTSAPSLGRLILTEHVSAKPAEGIYPELFSATLDAWSAQTGKHLWSAMVVPPRREKIECNPYANFAPTSFNVTSNGRWAAWSLAVPYGGCNSCQPAGGDVVNLTTGAIRSDPRLYGVLGAYIVDSRPYQPVTTVTITNPADGANLGSFMVTQARHFVDNASEQMVPLAASNYFPNAPAALSSDGDRLIMLESKEDGLGTIVAYSLPGMGVEWRWHPAHGGARSAVPELVADGGDVLLIYAEEPSGDQALMALDDRTGRVLWSLPSLPNEEKSTGPVCGASNSETLAYVNGDYAILDIHSGKQISYESTGPACGTILPGGIEVQQAEQSTTVVQRLTP